jgi:hypothetical protein
MNKTPEEIYKWLGDNLDFVCIASIGCPYHVDDMESCGECYGPPAESWRRFIEEDTSEKID